MYTQKVRTFLLCTLAFVTSLLIWRATKSDADHHDHVYEVRKHRSHIDIDHEKLAHDVERMVEEATAHAEALAERMEAHAGRIHVEVDVDSDGDKGDPVIKESFEVRQGGLLKVEVPNADLEILPGSDDQADVTVYLAARDMNRAREYFDELEFQVYADGNTVVVKAEKQNRRFWNNWRRKGGARITVEARIPVDFNTDLATSGGDITVVRLNGNAALATSGGDVTLGALTGNQINVRTSGGDIEAEELDGDVTLKTSGGDIELGRIMGPTIHVGTSGGDISARLLDAEDISVSTSGGDIELEFIEGDLHARTSGGDIDVDNIEGDLDASTSGGDIEVTLSASNDVRLSTSGGSIEIDAPNSLHADVNLRGGQVLVDKSFQFSGTLKKQRAEGRINGGGPHISASTNGGRVVLEAAQ